MISWIIEEHIGPISMAASDYPHEGLWFDITTNQLIIVDNGMVFTWLFSSPYYGTKLTKIKESQGNITMETLLAAIAVTKDPSLIKDILKEEDS